MELSCQLHALLTLGLGKEPRDIQQGAGCIASFFFGQLYKDMHLKI